MSKKGKKNRKKGAKVSDYVRNSAVVKGQMPIPTMDATSGAKTSSVVSLTPQKAKCHAHYPTEIHCMGRGEGGPTVWAGGRQHVQAAIDLGHMEPVLVFNLSGLPAKFKQTFPVKSNGPAVSLLPASVLNKVIVDIDWDDGGVPSALSKQWWQDLSDAVDRVDGDVVICCVGGHGRTGTMLTILLALGGHIGSGECPVEYMRSIYCDEAVETEEQIEYIEQITGLEVTSYASSSGWLPYTVYGGVSDGATYRQNSGWHNPNDLHSPGQADYEVAQTGSEVTAGSLQKNYGIRDVDPSANGYDETGDYVMDGIRYRDEDDFIEHEDEHNASRGD